MYRALTGRMYFLPSWSRIVKTTKIALPRSGPADCPEPFLAPRMSGVGKNHHAFGKKFFNLGAGNTVLVAFALVSLIPIESRNVHIILHKCIYRATKPVLA